MGLESSMLRQSPLTCRNRCFDLTGSDLEADHVDGPGPDSSCAGNETLNAPAPKCRKHAELTQVALAVAEIGEETLKGGARE